MLRDAMLPVLWIEGWRGEGFVWRGNTMDIDESRIASN
jgi:ceramide glucosyltransferase